MTPVAREVLSLHPLGRAASWSQEQTAPPLATRDRSGALWFCGYGATGAVPALQGLRRGVARTPLHSRNPQGKESPNPATSGSHFARYCPGRSDLNHDLLPPDGGHGRYEGGTGVTAKPGHRAGLRAFHDGRTGQKTTRPRQEEQEPGTRPPHSLLASQPTPALHLGAPWVLHPPGHPVARSRCRR